MSDARFDLTLKTNVYGYFQMAKAAVPYLTEGSAIINTGSVTGLEGSAHLLDYSTTKGAIHAFTKSLARNLLPRGIRVNAVAPGPVWTPLNPADKPPRQITRFGRDTDMHRVAQPEEISPAYVFLASPVCSGYITGIVLPITGSVSADRSRPRLAMVPNRCWLRPFGAFDARVYRVYTLRMSIHVALTHVTHYKYDRLVEVGPQTVRLRPAPHCRTRILSYSLKIEPAKALHQLAAGSAGQLPGARGVPRAHSRAAL